MKLNKKATFLTLTGLVVMSGVFPMIGGFAAGNPNLTLEQRVKNYGNGHESLNESPFSFTQAGAVPNDFMQYIVTLENSGDDANNVKVKVNLPDETVVGKKAAVYVVGSAGFDIGPAVVGATSIKYFDDNSEITPAGSDSDGRDERVDSIEFALEKVPSGTVGSSDKEIKIQYSVRMAKDIGESVVNDVNASVNLTSTEVANVSGNEVHTKLSGKPEFKTASDTFKVQAGPNEESDDWKNDSVEIDPESDAFLGVWVKNLFHNTTANNPVIEVTWPQEYKNEHTLTATISGSNVSSVSDTVKVKIKNGQVNKLEVIDGSLMYQNYNSQSIGATITKTANGFRVAANDSIVGGNANVTLVNAHLRAVKQGTTTPTPTPTKEKIVEKEFITEKVEKRVVITELPKTGPEIFGLIGALGAIPSGLFLRKFKSKKNDFISFGHEVLKRNSKRK